MTMAQCSSSCKTSDDIIPYQFEPRRHENESDGWKTVDDEEEELDSDSDIESELRKKKRNEMDAEKWCLCGHCQRKFTAAECICCKELDESDKLVSTEEIGEYPYSTSNHCLATCLVLIW